MIIKTEGKTPREIVQEVTDHFMHSGVTSLTINFPSGEIIVKAKWYSDGVVSYFEGPDGFKESTSGFVHKLKSLVEEELK